MHRKIDDRGATLTEMIVVFALLGIMLAAAAQLIYSSTDIYYHAKAQSNGMQVSQLIMTKLENELEKSWEPDTEIIISSDGQSIEYIKAGEEKLLLIEIGTDGKLRIDKGGKSLMPFNSSAYMGYVISSLSFSMGGTLGFEEYPENVICAELEITGSPYGEYRKVSYIRLN